MYVQYVVKTTYNRVPTTDFRQLKAAAHFGNRYDLNEAALLRVPFPLDYATSTAITPDTESSCSD